MLFTGKFSHFVASVIDLVKIFLVDICVSSETENNQQSYLIC